MAAQHFSGGPVPGASGSSAGNTIIVGPIQPQQHDRITGSVFSDKAGTLKIEQSGNSTDWDISTSRPVVANTGLGFSEEIILAYVRVTFENTAGSDTTVFRLYARTTSAGSR